MNPYETIGVHKKSSQDEVSKAFRKKAEKLHPDRGGKTRGFQKLSKAYGILKSPEKRKQYDETGDVNSVDQNPLINISIQRVLMLIDEIMSKTENVLSIDIIGLSRKHIRKSQNDIKNAINRTTKEIETLKKLKLRFKFKKKKGSISDDIVKNMITDKIKTAKVNIHNLKNEIKIINISLKILNCYSFESYQDNNRFSTMTFANTTSTTGW